VVFTGRHVQYDVAEREGDSSSTTNAANRVGPFTVVVAVAVDWVGSMIVRTPIRWRISAASVRRTDPKGNGQRRCEA
jgi:hypothetical protein